MRKWRILAIGLLEIPANATKIRMIRTKIQIALLETVSRKNVSFILAFSVESFFISVTEFCNYFLVKLLDHEKKYETWQKAQSCGNAFDVTEVKPEFFYGRVTVKCRPKADAKNKWKKGSPIMLVAKKPDHEIGDHEILEFEGVVLESTPKEISLVFEETFIKQIRIDETVILQDISERNIFLLVLSANSFLLKMIYFLQTDNKFKVRILPMTRSMILGKFCTEIKRL